MFPVLRVRTLLVLELPLRAGAFSRRLAARSADLLAAERAPIRVLHLTVRSTRGCSSVEMLAPLRDYGASAIAKILNHRRARCYGTYCRGRKGTTLSCRMWPDGC